MEALQNDDARLAMPTLEDEADKILQLHGGDGRQAVMTLLVEMDSLQDRLWVAKIAMGQGFTRGWKP